MRPTPFPARIISRKRWDGRPFTIRPNAASSARSGNAWNTGPSCGGSGVEDRINNCWFLRFAPALRALILMAVLASAHGAAADTLEVAPGVQVTKRTYTAPVNEQPFFGFAVKTNAQREGDYKLLIDL